MEHSCAGLTDEDDVGAEARADQQGGDEEQREAPSSSSRSGNARWGTTATFFWTLDGCVVVVWWSLRCWVGREGSDRVSTNVLVVTTRGGLCAATNATKVVVMTSKKRLTGTT
jgi:hypothetical protein